MGKASRQKRHGTVRERIAAQQAAQRRTEVRNRVLAVTAVVVVIAVVVVFVVIKATQKPTASASTLPTGSELSKITSQATSVPPSALDAVGKGNTLQAPNKLSGQPPLKSNGKPEMLYIGAEFCPYCATERWAMAVALSRFGTFSNLNVTHSDVNDQPSNIKTLTFYKSSYSSKYLVFTPVEQTDPNKKPLQNLTSEQQALISKYDAPPYVQGQGGAIPFIDIGGKYIVSGATYSYALLQGKSWSQISAALHDPSSPIAKGALGAANALTAAICKTTGNQPGNVCNSKAVTSAGLG